MLNIESQNKKIKSRKKTIKLLLNKEIIDKQIPQSCSICLGIFNNPVVTSCGHRFCWDCLNEWYLSNKHECPQCRKHLSLFDTSITNKIEDRISKYTKLVKLIHPGVTSDVRYFGGTVLQNEVKDVSNFKLTASIIFVFLVLFYFLYYQGVYS